ncbi:conserved exported protein of unknown function [Tenacibaculum sp. 190130A14a]|uniref:DUF3179 domain-containing protein n=1 Tax=Tenacibaculum polynesiense TaxID=3137857 RepID=A0ABP1F1U3_9FLAO
MRFLVLFLTVLICSCSSSNEEFTPNNNSNNGSGSGAGSGTNSGNNSGNTANQWIVSVSQIIDAGPGKDGIPSLDTPVFIDINTQSYLNDDDLIVGITINGKSKAYPYKILNYHEVVNDIVGGSNLTISHCPLTGTSFGWSRIINGEVTTFGVSGLLYNSNLILYDRKTDSNWFQMGEICANGELRGRIPTGVKVIETTLGEWKKFYPNSEVLSKEQGFSKPYDKYPYRGYLEDDDLLLFPVSPINDRLPKKERVFAVITGATSKVYRRESFGEGLAKKDVYKGEKLLIVGNKDLITCFQLNESQEDLVFEYTEEGEGVMFKDNEGNKWSPFGLALEGPRKGTILRPKKSLMTFWFAVAAFFPEPILDD